MAFYEQPKLGVASRCETQALRPGLGPWADEIMLLASY